MGERHNLRNMYELEVRKHYQIEITNRFAAFENSSDGKDVNRVWENIKEDKKYSAKSLGLHELKQHKPWFDEECLGFLDQRKQAKLQWVQDPYQSNIDNLNDVRPGLIRYFRNKKKKYLRAKFEEITTNNKVKNIRVMYKGIKTLIKVTILELISKGCKE